MAIQRAFAIVSLSFHFKQATKKFKRDAGGDQSHGETWKGYLSETTEGVQAGGPLVLHRLSDVLAEHPLGPTGENKSTLMFDTAPTLSSCLSVNMSCIR